MLQTALGEVEPIFSTLESARPSVAAHSRRVAIYATRLATQFGVDHHSIETIRLGALLHDVGKMLVPARILSKPTRPNKREWQELKIHPELGMEIAHRAGFDDDVCSIVLYHHERWDGKGYPDGAIGSAVHWTVRVVSVMDMFDAITSPRQYRESLSIDAARIMIAREAGRRFCPWIVSGLMSLPSELLQPPVIDAAESYAPEGMGHHTAWRATEPWRAAVAGN
jgi:putative nucleotidyltransferase with HDIG domain